jgi:precorrin-2/cobalt-factor-2 C20-methyltransferase
MKSGKSIASVKDAIKEKNLEDKTFIVQNCGLPNEQVCKNIDEISDDISYFTTIIVKE